MPFDWSQLSPEERGNAFRAHHSGNMPYPDEVDIDQVLAQLTTDNDQG